MQRHLLLAAALLVLTGCARNTWPDPPPVDLTEYQKEFEAWRAEHRQGLSYVLPIVGIWPLQEGETPFGSDQTLPIVLPAAYFPRRAGIIRRSGDEVTIVPEPGATLRLDDGTPLSKPTVAESFGAGPVHLSVASAGDDRRWLTGMDGSHPASKNPPEVETYPLDTRWRVAARYDAFERPKPVRVPDVRGGEMQFMATGQLVFRLADQEAKLTAFGEPGSEDFFVMFKDPTNQSTTYRGYRIVTPKAVKDDEWTTIDFNFASNPPCAYSKYTLCPLPPPENKLPVAVEAGLKRLPSAQGYSE
jgi:uncharacterized protein (DUF1684 family)